MSPSFLERIQSFDGTGKTGGVERATEQRRIDTSVERVKGSRVIPEHAVLLTKAQAHKYMSDYAKRVGEPGHVTRNIGDRALEALAVVKAERKLIATIRQALKEYDRYVRPDKRVNNGGKRVDAKALAKGVKLIRSGMSIRRASAVTGISYSTLWVAKGRS